MYMVQLPQPSEKEPSLRAMGYMGMAYGIFLGLIIANFTW